MRAKCAIETVTSAPTEAWYITFRPYRKSRQTDRPTIGSFTSDNSLIRHEKESYRPKFTEYKYIKTQLLTVI